MMNNLSLSERDIRHMLVQLYQVFGLRIGIHDSDMRIMLEYPVISPVYRELGFCDKIRTHCPSYKGRCLECDLTAFQHVRETQQTYIYKCHMGFSEAVIPIILDGEVQCIMMIGQALLEPPTEQSFVCLLSQLQRFDAEGVAEMDLEDLAASYFAIKVLRAETFSAYAFLIENCVQNIYLHRMLRIRERSFIENFEEYVAEQLTHRISIGSVAEHFGISQTHLSRLIKANTGQTFTQYLALQRICRAQELLLTTHYTIKEIAVILRFQEVSYFTRLFKRVTGMTCTEYRKNRTQ